MSDPAAGNLEPLARRVHGLEKKAERVPDAATDIAWRAALTCATVVALGLPFLWDHTARPDTTSVAGWHLLFYGLNDHSHLDSFVRCSALYVLVPALASLAVAQAKRRVAVAVIVLDIFAAVLMLIVAAKGGTTAGTSNDAPERTGDGVGLWVAMLLLVGWAVMCARRLVELEERT